MKIRNKKKKTHSSVVDGFKANTEQTPQICTVYVCSLCLENHGTLLALRQHMISDHRYIGDANEDISEGNGIVSTMASDQRDLELDKIRPMSFRDFRCFLRAPLVHRCTVAYECGYKFVSADKLVEHVKCHMTLEAKQRPPPFRCYVCGGDYDNWRRCSEHLWQQHNIDVDMLKCHLCDFKAHTSVSVWRHMRFHSKWRPRVLRSLKAVKRRQDQNKHDTKTAKPASSPIASTPKSKVQQRSKYYAEKTCEICDRKFVNGKTLSKHVKTVHNKIKPFICTVCGLKTARKASLTVHMRQHTGEKPLHCSICKFSTRDPSALHKHQSRHQEQGGKLKCKLCSYSCIQANAYKRHMRLKHPDEYKRIACCLCSYVTINEDKLLSHIDDHRKGLITNCEDSMDDTRTGRLKYPQKARDKHNDISVDCFMPLESVDSLPHEPTVDTGGVTIPAPSTEDTQFPL